jgi:hypothetical protein
VPVDAVMLNTSTMQIAEKEKRTNRRFRITLEESVNSRRSRGFGQGNASGVFLGSAGC